MTIINLFYDKSFYLDWFRFILNKINLDLIFILGSNTIFDKKQTKSSKKQPNSMDIF